MQIVIGIYIGLLICISITTSTGVFAISSEKDWIDILQAFATPSIALAGAAIAWSNFLLQRNKRNDDMFDRRFKAYSDARDALAPLDEVRRNRDQLAALYPTMEAEHAPPRRLEYQKNDPNTTQALKNFDSDLKARIRMLFDPKTSNSAFALLERINQTGDIDLQFKILQELENKIRLEK